MSKWPVYYAFQEERRLLTKELFSLRSHTSVEQAFVLLKQLSNQCASTQWDYTVMARETSNNAATD